MAATAGWRLTCPEHVGRVGDRHDDTSGDAERAANEADAAAGHPQLHDGNQQEAGDGLQQEAGRLEVADHDRRPAEWGADDVQQVDVVAAERDERLEDKDD